MKCTKKVTFLFGAGAEGKSNFELPTGFEYLQQSLFYSEDTDKSLTAVLKEYFKHSYFKNTFKYTTHTIKPIKNIFRNFVFSKAQADNIFFINKQDLILSIINDEQMREINLMHAPNKDFERIKNQFPEDIFEEFENIILLKIKKYSDINSDFLRSIFTDEKNGIGYDLNTGVAGLLDGYFHSINDPNKYGRVKFSWIFNYYWSCYFCIISKIVDYIGIENFTEFISNDKLDFFKVMENIVDFTNKLYDAKIEQKNSYYNLLKNKFDVEKKKYELVGVATTNYFKFVESLHDIPAYLNGKLNLFEFPELLEVSDATKIKSSYNSKSLFFPFIFGQSLIKPIVNDKQIKEFKIFSDYLEESDILVILGYNINEDDNHINAYLSNFSKRKKILVVVSKEDNVTVREISNKMKTSDVNVVLCTVEYGNNKPIIDCVFEELSRIEL